MKQDVGRRGGDKAALRTFLKHFNAQASAVSHSPQDWDTLSSHRLEMKAVTTRNFTGSFPLLFLPTQNNAGLGHP